LIVAQQGFSFAAICRLLKLVRFIVARDAAGGQIRRRDTPYHHVDGKAGLRDILGGMTNPGFIETGGCQQMSG
jgi:hypothetical protein